MVPKKWPGQHTDTSECVGVCKSTVRVMLFALGPLNQVVGWLILTGCTTLKSDSPRTHCIACLSTIRWGQYACSPSPILNYLKIFEWWLDWYTGDGDHEINVNTLALNYCICPSSDSQALNKTLSLLSCFITVVKKMWCRVSVLLNLSELIRTRSHGNIGFAAPPISSSYLYCLTWFSEWV